MFYKQTPPNSTDRRYFPDEAKVLQIKHIVFKSIILPSSFVKLLEKYFEELRNDFGAELTFKIDHVDLQNTELQDLKIQKIYLFHQSKSQQYLLKKYGIFVHLTEVKSQKGQRPFGISLFLICVRTNVDYQVVGTILCNKYNNHTKVLKEALTEFKKINKFWKPKYLMIDPSEAMISVVEELFSGSLNPLGIKTFAGKNFREAQ